MANTRQISSGVKGYSYLEVLLAFTLLGIGLLGFNKFTSHFIQTLLQQRRIQGSQLLFSSAVHRLSVNRAYVKQTRESSIYFSSVDPEQDCNNIVSPCFSGYCSSEQLAQKDMSELHCTAQQLGLKLSLQLTSFSPELMTINAVTSSLTTQCNNKNCSLVVRELYL